MADILTGLQVHYKFDTGSGSSAVDSSGNGNTGTLQNSPSWIDGRIGTNALSFNGSNQYITTPLTNLNLSAGTVSWWMKPSTNYDSGAIRAFWGQLTVGNTNPEFTAQIFLDNNWYIGWNGASDRRVTLAASSSNYINGQWAFYTFTWDASGSNLYMNTSLIGTNGNTPPVSNIGDNFTVARQGTGSSNYFPGAIDDFRIYNRVLSSDDITALYTDITTGLILRHKYDEGSGSSAIDSSGNSNTGSLVNSPSYVAGKIGLYALSLNGINQLVTVPHSSSLNIAGTGSVTMCAWIYPTANPPAYAGIMAKRDDSISPPYIYGINYNSSASFQVYTSGPSGIVGFAYQPTLNTWVHIVGVIDSFGATKLYLNGSLFSSGGSGGGVTQSAANFCVGNSFASSGEFFPGTIDDVRVYNRALTATDIAALYAFTEPIVTTGNPAFLLKMI